MGPYPQPRSRTWPVRSAGTGASVSSSLVPGSTSPPENTPRSVDEVEREVREVQAYGQALGWRAWIGGRSSARRPARRSEYPRPEGSLGPCPATRSASSATPCSSSGPRRSPNIDGSLVRLVDDMVEHDVRGAWRRPGRPPGGRAEAALRLRPPRRARRPHPHQPHITETRGEWEYEEGCLSVPGLFFPIVRPKEVHLTGYDLDGNEVSIEADELAGPAVPARARPPRRRLLLEHLDDDQRKEAMKALRKPQLQLTPIGVRAVRLAFLGTPDAAVAPLERSSPPATTSRLVVTQPDRKRGRGGALVPSPVKAAALELGSAGDRRVDGRRRRRRRARRRRRLREADQAARPRARFRW